MTSVDWGRATPIEAAALPAVITDYLAAHHTRDLDAATAALSPAAQVVDEGHTYQGVAQIRDWLARAASEYTFTSTLTGASMVDPGHFDVLHHVVGDFPGGVVDLHYRFTLVDGLVAALRIEE